MRLEKVTYACNPSTQVAEAVESRVHGQPGLHGRTLSEKTE